MNRQDFVLVFDVKDANPNGDPDAGNLPRIDPESGHGLVTDVALKRKVRNFVGMTKDNVPPHRIYFRDGIVLNDLHKEAYTHAGIEPDTKKKNLPRDAEKAMEVTRFMCSNYYDIRTFGAVMTTAVNCGQVRGPVQLSFARSVDPIFSSEHAITRNSVTNEKDLDKERTMGRKFTVPYAVYVAHGFVNPFLAKKTGFSEDDLELTYAALQNAFQFDASAARPPGSMNVRKFVVFEHGDELGSAPSHVLFDSVSLSMKGELSRSFDDYEFDIDRGRIPESVSVVERIDG
ncbi:MAG: type I-C CRISPR-associated protein Cas7/Csd2 [Myxococcota bacterium]